MLSRLHRMSAGMVRFLFRQHLQKIHAPHLMARVFFLPEAERLPNFLKNVPHGARFAILLPRGSYKNSVDMHARRRAVYTALGSALAECQKTGRLVIPCLSGVSPKDSFFTLQADEQSRAAAILLESLFTSSTSS